MIKKNDSYFNLSAKMSVKIRLRSDEVNSIERC